MAAYAHPGGTTPSRGLPWILLVSGTVGFIASFVLTIDKIKLLQNPHYAPPCNINPVISCGSVMKTWQASALGFSNSLIGVAAFAVLIFVGISLLAGTRYSIRIWRLMLLGGAAGVLFAGWLIFQSLYRIHSLCPYCMAVWAVTITSFWYVLLANLQQSKLPFINDKQTGFLVRHHVDILAGVLLLVTGIVLQRFWYFFNPF